MTTVSPVVSRVVRVAGHRIHLREAGDGPIVLLIHGFPETSYSWRRQMDALVDAGYRAVAIDQLGCGRSAKPQAVVDYRITERVDIAVGVVEALGASTAAVVGHDWGASVGWTAAWTRPDVFRGVVGVSIPFGARNIQALPGSPLGDIRPSELERRIAGDKKVWYQDYIRRMGVVAEEDAERDLRTWLASFYYWTSADQVPPLPVAGTFDEIVGVLRVAPSSCLEPGQLWSDSITMSEQLPAWLPQDEFEVLVEEVERSGIHGPMNAYRTLDLDWELLAPWAGRRLDVPALYVRGDRDVPAWWTQQSVDVMPEVAPEFRGTVTLRNCGHTVHQERPEEFNRALLDFLSKL